LVFCQSRYELNITADSMSIDNINSSQIIDLKIVIIRLDATELRATSKEASYLW
jgi:hypothetical protein